MSPIAPQPIGSARAWWRRATLMLALALGASLATLSIPAQPAPERAQQATATATAVPTVADLPGWLAYTRRTDSQYVWELYRSRADGSDESQLTHHGSAGKGVFNPRWQPDGKSVGYVTTDKAGEVVSLWRLSVAGTTPTALATVRTNALAPAAPYGDDDLVVVGQATGPPSTTDLYRLPILGGEDQLDALLGTAIVDEDSPEWSAALGRFAYMSKELQGPAADQWWNIALLNPETKSVTPVTSRVGASECYPRVSPDGARLAYVAVASRNCFGRGALWVVDLATGQERELLREVGVQQPAWSPDGAWIMVYNTYDGGLVVPPGEGAPTPPPAFDRQHHGLYVLRVEDLGLFRLRGAAGGAAAARGSFLWGQEVDWTGGTRTSTPIASDTPTASPSPTASPTRSTSSTPTASATRAGTTVTPPSPTATGGSPSASAEISPTRPTLDHLNYLPILARDAPIEARRRSSMDPSGVLPKGR